MNIIDLFELKSKIEIGISYTEIIFFSESSDILKEIKIQLEQLGCSTSLFNNTTLQITKFSQLGTSIYIVDKIKPELEKEGFEVIVSTLPSRYD